MTDKNETDSEGASDLFEPRDDPVVDGDGGSEQSEGHMHVQDWKQKLHDIDSSRLPDWNWPWIGSSLLLVALIAAVLGGSWYLVGTVDTVIYVFLFLLGLGAVPLGIMMLAPSLPRSIGAPLGRGMWICQQLCFGTGYLVEFPSEYRICLGDDDGRVYINGEWHDVAGMDNMTMLGWQPFGSIRYKDSDTLNRERVDDTTGRTTTDGGARPAAADIATMGIDDVMSDDNQSSEADTTTRGGYTDFGPPDRPDGWVLDLKAVFSAGLKQIGDIANIEKAEEVAMREDAKDGVGAGNEVLIGSVVGLILGIASGYVTLFI